MNQASEHRWGLAPKAGMTHWWGARAILAMGCDLGRGREIDLVWDRQGFYEVDEHQGKSLSEWLNEKALPYLRAWAEDRQGFPCPEEDHQISLWGDGYVLHANPCASHGYLYMVAGPDARATEPTPVFKVRPVNDSKSQCKRCGAYSGSKHKAECPSRERVLARQAREGGPRDPDRRKRRPLY